jgi:hypothetical protein
MTGYLRLSSITSKPRSHPAIDGPVTVTYPGQFHVFARAGTANSAVGVEPAGLGTDWIVGKSKAANAHDGR